MTTVDKTDKSETDTIRFELELAHAPAKVWRALTEPELLAEWLLPVLEGKLALEPGAKFTFKTQAYENWDGTVHCKLVAIEPQKKLSYTWAAGGDLELDTVVTFTLDPTETGSRLSIVQSGFKPTQKQVWGGARYGWKMMGDKLFDLLARVA